MSLINNRRKLWPDLEGLNTWQVGISTITLSELEYGVSKSANRSKTSWLWLNSPPLGDHRLRLRGNSIGREKEMPIGHGEASIVSQGICENLESALRTQLENEGVPGFLKRSEIGWCRLDHPNASKALAWIDHRKQKPCIDVWCLGNRIDLQPHTSLEIRPRKTVGTWKDYSGVFVFSEDVDEGSELLFHILTANG